MRIRTIKPEFFLHEGLYELEKETELPLRLAFAGLWCAADREGRFKWEARRLGIQILPYDGVDFSRVLHALTTRGFVRKYEVEGVVFGCIPTFGIHQVINNRESPSVLPEPPQNIEPDAWLTRGSRDDDGNAELKSGREGKGKEGNGNPHTQQAGARTDGVWPDPREYPTLETVKAWAVAVMAPPECAEKWHAERTAEGWTASNGRKPLRCEESALRPLFGFYATAWKTNAATPRRNGYARPAADSFDIKPSWES
jgi:hypothetical protein